MFENYISWNRPALENNPTPFYELSCCNFSQNYANLFMHGTVFAIMLSKSTQKAVQEEGQTNKGSPHLLY